MKEHNLDPGRTAGKTWLVTRSGWVTPALVLFILGVLFLLCEALARTPLVQAGLLAPSVASPSRPFEIKLDRLHSYVRENGRPDCFFVGSSLVLTGIDPDVFADAYRGRRGQSIDCFNAAAPGMTASDVAALSQIIVEDYRPDLLLYGATFPGFSAAAIGPGLRHLPWIRYRLGHLDFEGFVTEHSHAYRYYLTYRHWRDAEQMRLLRRSFDFAANGFWPRPPRGVDLDAMVTRALEALPDLMKRHEIDESQVEAFTRLLRLGRQGVQILVVEIPGPVRFSRRLTATPKYRAFLDRLQQETKRAATPFWQPWKTIPGDVVPEDGWVDFYHMNTIGAEAFSRWLGQRVADAVEQGELRGPKPAGAARR